MTGSPFQQSTRVLKLRARKGRKLVKEEEETSGLVVRLGLWGTRGLERVRAVRVPGLGARTCNSKVEIWPAEVD